MVCIKIMGGQGNQMFQYALGRYLSLKNNCPLGYEMSYFDGKKARIFALNRFNTVGKSIIPKWWIRMYSKMPRGKRLLAKFLPLIAEQGSCFHPEVKTLTQKDVYLVGYWCSPKYFDDIRDVLIRDFTCKVSLSKNTEVWQRRIRSDKLPTVSLHIRRGDYLQSKINRQIYKVISFNYYAQCLQALTKKLGEISVYIFSDDMDWVKEHIDFHKNRIHYVVGNDEDHGFEDMILMWECEHHIIANSTFSWWGAYLSTQKGMTFCPKEWYNIKNNDYDIQDLYPNEWICIDV